MAQEETKVKVTYDDLKPFIVEVGKKIHDMLFEAQIKHGNRYFLKRFDYVDIDADPFTSKFIKCELKM